MRLQCSFDTPTGRSGIEDYVRHLRINVFSFDKEILDEYLVAKLAMDQILWNDALTDGESLMEICDSDSQGMHEAYIILTNGHDTFRPDLEIKVPVTHVMFLWAAVFHPSIHQFRQGILDAAFRLFGDFSVALMWMETSGLPESELADLGFKKIAGQPLIFRHSLERTRFSDGFPKGQDADVEALPEYEDWVNREWSRFKNVADD